MAASARRLYMFLGGTFLAGGGLIAVACSTDNGTTTSVPTVNDSGRDTGNGSSSGGSSGGSSGSVQDAGADCVREGPDARPPWRSPWMRHLRAATTP